MTGVPRAPSPHRSRQGSPRGAAPLIAVVGLLVAVNLLNNRLWPRGYLLTCLTGTALLVGLARWDGCSAAELGLDRRQARRGLRWGGACAGLVLAAYAGAAAVPATRPVLADDRAAGLAAGEVLQRALVRVPLGTVLLEETAFRGVLLAMLARRFGTRAAVAVSSSLFGLWHVLPARGLRSGNAAVRSLAGEGGVAEAVPVVPVAAVVVTAAGGVVLCELRRRSGSLLAPLGLHWALNGFGFAVAWLATRPGR